MVKFIESELILLKKEIDEMWTLVYNQLDRDFPYLERKMYTGWQYGGE